MSRRTPSSGPQHPTRRGVLGALSALAAAGATGCKTSDDGGETDVDTDALRSPYTAIEHFVILMMENRSFDHVFGSLSLDEGRTDVDGLTDGLSNPGPDDTVVEPFVLTHECIVDPGHGWDGSRRQLADGENTGFVLDFTTRTDGQFEDVMGYHDRAALPVSYALADGYALCDRWFCSVLGPTMPNRFYSYAGTSGGMKANEPQLPVQLRTIFAQLTEAGVTWAVYANIPAAVLFDGMITSGNVRPLDEYFTALSSGTLPQVVFLEPDYGGNDDHPPQPARLGQVLIGSIYKALAQSDYWDRSVFILDYDEHGGFYDHVAPPKVEDDHAADGFDQLGFRIPAVVCGPYAKPGVCVHTQFDHTSVLKTIQERFGIAEALSKRNETANPLWDCLDLDAMQARSPRAPVELPVVDVTPEEYDETCYQPGSLTGQPELEAAYDSGKIPAKFDRRAFRRDDLNRLLARAVGLGVARIVPG